MIDLHTHIIPNVDDGANSFDDALKMLNLEIENNVDTVILTPHYFLSSYSKTNWNLVRTNYKKLVKLASGLPIKLLLGAEVYYSKLVYEALKNNNIPTLNRSKYVLIEFSLVDEYYNIEEVLYNIQCLGYKPVLAHPERYLYLPISSIENMHNSGILIQMNTSSILKDFGGEIYRRAKKMLKLNCVDLVASDAHSSNVRKPNLKSTLELIEKKHKVNIENKIDL